jgi:hypothetical protein
MEAIKWRARGAGVGISGASIALKSGKLGEFTVVDCECAILISSED